MELLTSTLETNTIERLRGKQAGKSQRISCRELIQRKWPLPGPQHEVELKWSLDCGFPSVVVPSGLVIFLTAVTKDLTKATSERMGFISFTPFEGMVRPGKQDVAARGSRSS